MNWMWDWFFLDPGPEDMPKYGWGPVKRSKFERFIIKIFKFGFVMFLLLSLFVIFYISFGGR